MIEDKYVDTCKTIFLFILLVVSIIVYGYKDVPANDIISNLMEITSIASCFLITITLAIRVSLKKR